MLFARRVFSIAGLLGLLEVLPMYFLKARIEQAQPPAITHPEYFYGFVGLCVAWQVGFLVIARDPIRFRPMMIPAVVEKAAWVATVVALAVSEGIASPTFGAAMVDLTLGVLFVVAYVKTAPEG